MRQISEPGRYKVTVAESGFAYNKNETEFLEVIFITEDAQQISKRYYLSAGAFKYTAENLVEVFGFDGDFDTVTDQLQGKPCEITVEEQKDEKGNLRLNKKGDPYMEVKFVNRPRELKKGGRPDLSKRFANLGIKTSNTGKQWTPNKDAKPKTGW